MAPHIFQLARALSLANSCLTPLWPECVMNRPGDNKFFHSAAPTIFLSDTLSLILSLCLFISLPFLTSDSPSLLIVAIFLAQCVQWWTGKPLWKQHKLQYTGWCAVWGLWVTELKKEECSFGIVAPVASNRSSTWMWPETLECVREWVVVWDRHYQ